MKHMFKDFKKFISRGNVLDLAVAVIIGGAFGRIVQSLVNHILMPIISLVFGQEGFENYKYVIKPADEVAGTTENAIYYGQFIQNIIDFIIIAFVIFMIVKVINKTQEVTNQKKLQEDAEKKAQEEIARKEQALLDAKKPTTESLLTDIKKLLEKNLKT
jgi:large conductance mechanosensitive channel